MLTIDEFKQRKEVFRRAKPSLFSLGHPDPPASASQIESVEGAIGCRLPQSYRDFLGARGGGDYPRFNIFSAYPESPHFLPRRVRELQSVTGENLLPIHDDEVGGFYVLKIAAGSASDAVYYWEWETRELSKQKYDSVLDMIADNVFSR